jgi:dynein regulatory complex protein 1
VHAQENRDTVTNQKAKLKRTKEALSKLKERYHGQDEKLKQENEELTEDYMRITEQFKDLQRKFRHFETIDRKKYEEVWSMNEAKVMEVGNKVLQAERLICQQVLGTEWVPLPEDYFTLCVTCSSAIFFFLSFEMSCVSVFY